MLIPSVYTTFTCFFCFNGDSTSARKVKGHESEHLASANITAADRYSQKVKTTHKKLQVSGTHQAVTSIVPWSANHQHRRTGLQQGGQRIRLRG